MTRVLSGGPRIARYTAGGLRTQAKRLHAPRVKWGNPAWLCVGSALVLSVLGVLAIGTSRPDLATKQVAFLCVALVGATGIATPHYRWLERWSMWIMAVALVALVFVLIPWVPESVVRPRNGARRWINLGPMDLQPSELAKIAYIMAVAAYLRSRDSYRRMKGLLLPLVLSLVPMGLVLKEPNLGMALLFLPTLFAMLIAAGAKLWHVGLVLAVGLSIAPLSYPVLRPHQKDRVDAMVAQLLGDERHLDDIGYQADRAKTIAGAGGWVGTGSEMTEHLVEYNKLPERHNDMVFAVAACRWGLAGATGIWFLFAAMCAGGLMTAWMCKDPFGRLTAVGIVAVMFAQMAINTGMTIGVLPITGLPLPFVSYGGSSLVATWLMVGIVFNIALRRPAYLVKDSFEFDEGAES